MAETEPAAAAPWLLCRAGRHLCALPLDRVAETMRPLPIQPLAAAPPFVRGLCVHRGTPVPVVDAGMLLGQSDARAERLVVIRTGDRMVALAVADIVGVRPLTSASQALPPLLREAASAAVSAIGVLDEELLLVLGTARIVPDALLEELAAAGPAP